MLWQLFFLLVFLAVIGWFLLPRRRKLSPSAKRRVIAAWDHALSLSDLHRRILEADKSIDLLLGELGYRGTLGEKLIKAQKILPDADAIWSAHKLRNRIAHLPGMHVTDGDALRAVKAFEKLIVKFATP